VGFRYIGESKDRVWYILIVVEDEIEYCIEALRGGGTEGPGGNKKGDNLETIGVEKIKKGF
jgi:hypothetical protein